MDRHEGEVDGRRVRERWTPADWPHDALTLGDRRLGGPPVSARARQHADVLVNFPTRTCATYSR